MSLCLEYAHWCSPSSSHLLIRPSKSIHPFGGRGRPNHFLRTLVRCGLHHTKMRNHAISKIQRTANQHRLREPQDMTASICIHIKLQTFLKLGFARIISCLHQPLRPIRVPRVPNHRRPFRHAVEVSQWYDDAPGPKSMLGCCQTHNKWFRIIEAWQSVRQKMWEKEKWDESVVFYVFRLGIWNCYGCCENIIRGRVQQKIVKV